MKKLLCAFCAAALAAAALAPPAFAESAPPETYCEAYIVMDADTGQVLLEKNADEVLYPASITKIMTMGLACEKAQGDWSTELTISYDVAHSLEARSTHIALLPGEVVRLEDVLYGTEMESANDGANALAEYIGGEGTIQAGVDLMNAKAAELGLTNTHYMNPHGLYADEHYTTARDMAVLTRWAITTPGFLDVFCRNEPWEMEATNLQKARTFHNIDWMRISGDYYRTYAKGSKAGFHDQAMTTFVNYAEQDGLRVISVEMKCPRLEDKFRDACAILDYTFEHFRRVEVPAPQDSFEVPLIGGGGALGNVTVRAVGASVLLHDDFTTADVQADYSVPEQYVLGQPFTAFVHFSLRENALQPTELGGETLEVTGLPEILQASTYVPQKSLSPKPNYLGLAVGAAVALAALVLVFRLLRRSAGEVKPYRRGKTRRAAAAEWDFIVRPSLPAEPLPPAPRQQTNSGYDANPRLPRK